MKMRLFSALVSILILATANGLADNYTISIPSGFRLIANHLDNGGNTLDEVLPGVVNGIQISKYNCDGSYTIYTKGAAGWTPVGGTLTPGEGAFINNNSGASFNLTFTGTPHVPVLPAALPCGCGLDNLVSHQTTNSLSTFEDIMGFTPAEGTLLYRWNGTGFVPNEYFDGEWGGGTPNVNLGEAVLIRIPSCPTTPIMACATNKTVDGCLAWSFDTPTNITINCYANYSLTSSTVTNSGPCPLVTTRTWLIRDICGNTNTCSQTVTVNCCTTNSCITLSCATNKIVPCGTSWSFDAPTNITDTCCTNYNITLSTVTNSGPCPLVTTRTWLVSDTCGKSNTCSQTVTVADTAPPFIQCPSNILVSSCSNVPVCFTAVAMDGCSSNLTVIFTPPSCSLFAPGTTNTVYCVATDGCSNSASCSFTVTVDLPPVIIQQPQSLTVTLGSSATFAVLASGTSPLTYQWRFNDTNIFGAISPSLIISNGLAVSAGLYDVIISGPCGSVTSRPAFFTLVDPNCCENKPWIQLATNGPSPRVAHAMAYDSTRRVVVLFGGTCSGQANNDTWEWDGDSWSNKTPANPSLSPGSRYGHAMAYDGANGKIIVFGGNNGSERLGDTWMWDGLVWQTVATAGPSPRFYHAMASENFLSNTVVLFGGDTSGGQNGETWEWSGVEWNQRVGSAPSARYSHAMAFDSIRNKVVLFGGNGDFLGDTWEWNGSVWMKMDVSGPPGRYKHAMAFDTRCARVELFGGNGSDGYLEDTWSWNGLNWAQSIISGPISRSGHATAFGGQRTKIVLFGGESGTNCLNDTWERGCQSPCDETERAELDANGEVILPADADPNTPTVDEDVSYLAGSVKDLYPWLDTRNDLWYGSLPCNPTFGFEVDPQDLDEPDLTDAGITNAMEEVEEAMETWASVLKTVFAVMDLNGLALAPPAAAPYTFPDLSHCTSRGTNAFGGRDIVFVHGFQQAPLLESILGTTHALWQQPTNFPGSIQNPEFYTGYWKSRANDYWKKHIDRYLTGKGFKNRYLIVAWPSTERLEIGLQAVLTQIGDAMQYGTGVVDLSGNNDTNKFGTPSFVVVSHSTGGPLTDAAMTAASTRSNLRSQHIPALCKAHVALHGAFSGTRIATITVAASLKLPHIPLPELPCVLAKLILFKDYPDFNCSLNLSKITNSVLVDLMPHVMQDQDLWRSSMEETPIRTLTVIGGHPSSSGSIIKRLLLPGFDDGTLTIDSQVGNPNPEDNWPSGFISLSSKRVSKDLGINTPPQSYLLRKRSAGYFKDQIKDPKPDELTAAGALPFISPTGMRQPDNVPFASSGYDPLARYQKHYSFLQSASDHFSSTPSLNDSTTPSDTYGFPGVNGEEYETTKAPFDFPVIAREHNTEETLAITDLAVYTPFTIAPYPNDNHPLLRSNYMPNVQLWPVEKSRWYKPLFSKKWKKKIKWHRDYYRLEGWQTMTECDYVYKYVLPDPVNLCPEIACPTNIVVVSCTNESVSYPMPVFSSSCGSNVTVVFTPPSGSVFTAGTTTNVHCVALDCSSNSVSCDFTVEIRCPTSLSALVATPGNLTFTWPTNLGSSSWRLQFKTNLNAGSPWETYQGATNPPIILPMTNAEQYFRLLLTNSTP